MAWVAVSLAITSIVTFALVGGAGLDGDWLAVAALLAAIHHGIKHRIDPGAPIEGDGYTLAAEQGLSLPRHWNLALDAFANSTAMRDYLGARFHQMFTAIKRSEYDRYHAQVTELDYDWYLRGA